MFFTFFKCSKEHHLFETEIFCDIINVFAVTFMRRHHKYNNVHYAAVQ